MSLAVYVASVYKEERDKAIKERDEARRIAQRLAASLAAGDGWGDPARQAALAEYAAQNWATP